MSQEDPIIVVRSRRALNDLQYSPNGKDIAGLSPRKGVTLGKKAPFEKTFGSSMKKRTSISLPDISSKANSSVAITSTSASTSTPCKSKHRVVSTSQCNTPIKFVKKDISIIMEEKENPQHHIFHHELEKASSECDLKSLKVISNRPRLTKYKDVSIQCCKLDEDMLLADNVDDTPYWKLLAHKRFTSLLKTKAENEQLNTDMAELDKINENLREKNKKLLQMLKEYEELKKLIVETIDNECDDDNEDSGYDRSLV